VTLLVITYSILAGLLPGTAHGRMAAHCSDKQTPARELHCGKRNLHHANSLRRFLKAYPRAGDAHARAVLRRDHRWLRRYAWKTIREAWGRMVPASPRATICAVFGSHCSEAIRVAWCESRMNVYARNGQYLGLFQFGEFARARYGFGWDALSQARAAYRYFLAAGWGPWECRP
jgi:hypothetical protein